MIQALLCRFPAYARYGPAIDGNAVNTPGFFIFYTDKRQLHPTSLSTFGRFLRDENTDSLHLSKLSAFTVLPKTVAHGALGMSMWSALYAHATSCSSWSIGYEAAQYPLGSPTPTAAAIPARVRCAHKTQLSSSSAFQLSQRLN